MTIEKTAVTIITAIVAVIEMITAAELPSLSMLLHWLSPSFKELLSVVVCSFDLFFSNLKYIIELFELLKFINSGTKKTKNTINLQKKNVSYI